MIGAIGRALLRPIKSGLALLGVMLMTMALLWDRNRAREALRRHKEKGRKAKETRKAVANEVENLSGDDLRKRHDRWLRK